jgi:heme/copper-type cytochrome/quinol oxidase subunit 1
MQIEALVAIGASTTAIIAGIAWYARKTFRRTRRSNLIPCLLLFLFIGGVMSFLLVNAAISGDAYGIGRRDRGELHSIAQEPATYWILVVIYYISVVAALSMGLAVAAELVRSWRR